MPLFRCLVLLGALLAALSTTPAHAFCIANVDVQSNVTGTAPSFNYSITAANGCALVNGSEHELNAFYLPYFADASIANIVAPAGWTFAIDAGNNLFNLAGAGVLTFTSDMPVPFSTFVTGFSFTSPFAGVKGPFAMDLTLLRTHTDLRLFGDPLIPASPDTVAALANLGVPTPPVTTLLSVALAWLMLHTRSRTKSPMTEKS